MPEYAASRARRAASKFSLLSASALSGHSDRYLKFPLLKKWAYCLAKPHRLAVTLLSQHPVTMHLAR
jgi:hypothetical protein